MSVQRFLLIVLCSINCKALASIRNKDPESLLIRPNLKNDISSFTIRGGEYALPNESIKRSARELKLVNVSGIDVNIIDQFQALTKVVFEGQTYDCENKTWLEFIEKSKLRGLKLVSGKATCIKQISDCKNDDFLFHILCSNVTKTCPEDTPGKKCHCQVSEDDLSVQVDCSNRSFADQDLPKGVPVWTTDLFLSHNKLRNVSSWLQNNLPSLKFLTTLDLSNNEINSVPFLPAKRTKWRKVLLHDDTKPKYELTLEDLRIFLRVRKDFLAKDDFKCDTKSLVISDDTVVKPSIFDKCGKLQIVIFEGGSYDCKNKEWEKFINRAKDMGVDVESRNANCRENAPTCTHDLIYHLLCLESKVTCEKPVEQCTCTAVIKRGLTVQVNCSSNNMWDHKLPTSFPPSTTAILVSNNELVDVTPWLNEVLPTLKKLIKIDLSQNKIRNVPSLPASPNKLQHIHLDGNMITKFRAEDFESYLLYKDLKVDINGSHWVCDCETEDFVKFMLKNVELFTDYTNLLCTAKGREERNRPWTYNCERKKHIQTFLTDIWDIFIVILVIANILLIANLRNLNQALADVNEANPREPWMEHMMKWLVEAKAKVLTRLFTHKEKPQ